MRFSINQDIHFAHTLPSEFYLSEEFFYAAGEKIFGANWLYVSDTVELNIRGSYLPRNLLPGFLNEPLLLTRDLEGKLHCLSNVCTHRGNLLATSAGRGRSVTCGYHGRCFDLKGKLTRMPGFDHARDFPSATDDLHALDLEEWLGMLFTRIAHGSVFFQEMIRPLKERIGWMPLNELCYHPNYSKTYTVNAHWALYCDNYLEGFHIPFVHKQLNAAIEFETYEYHCFDHCNLQIAFAKEGELRFDLPLSSPEYGKHVFAYYFFVFPNMMFNFYPWGLSFNFVEPISPVKSRIHFRTYLLPDQEGKWTESALDITELEDEKVVEQVQKGIASRFYHRGRFSPQLEICVHHFHRMLAAALL